jgi:hypothetical protein
MICRTEIGRCVPSSATGAPPPALDAAATIAPTIGTRGTTFTLTFGITAALFEAPTVTLDTGSGPASFANDASASGKNTFVFHYTASGSETPGAHQVSIVAIDSSGNTATLSGPPLTLDFTPPGLQPTANASSTNSATVVFTKPVTPSSAEDASHYLITPSLSIVAAALASDNQTLSLVTSDQTPGTSYTVVASNVFDSIGNAIGTANAATFTGFGNLPDDTPPTPLSPSTNAVVDLRTSFNFAWTPRTGASAYEFQLSDTTDFSDVLADIDTAETSLSAPGDLPVPSAPVTYYWRVRSDVTAETFDTSYPSASFDGLDGTVRVYCPASATCSDSGRVGNLSKPMQTIIGGIGLADVRGIHTVDVAGRGGSAAYAEQVSLLDGISVYGGYNPAFTTTSATTAAIIENLGAVAVSVTNFTGTSTVFDGFSIVTGPNIAPDNFGIFIASVRGITISHCNINPGPAINSSVGIEIDGSGGTAQGDGPLVIDNVITAGATSNYASCFSTGIEVKHSAVSIVRNTIKGGDIISQNGSTSHSYSTWGLNTSLSNGIYDGNFISGGNAFTGSSLGSSYYATSLGVQLNSGTDSLTNNVIAAGAADYQAFTFQNSGSGATSLANNTFFSPTQNPNVTPPTGAAALQAHAGGVRDLLIEQPTNLVNNLFAAEAPLVATQVGTSALYIAAPADTTFVQNNSFFGFAAYADDYCETPYPCTNAQANASSMESYYGSKSIPASGNTDVTTLTFADASCPTDGACALSTPTDNAVLYGGLDASQSNCGTGAAACGGVTTDATGAARTCPAPTPTPIPTSCYSRGAFEY